MGARQFACQGRLTRRKAAHAQLAIYLGALQRHAAVMSTLVLIPGAGGAAWYWHRVVPLLEAAGHEALAVDLPGDDEQAGLSTYAERVLGAIGTRTEIVLVAQSLGGFTAPLVCERASVRTLVLVNAMIPVAGETPGDWWANTGWEAARSAAAQREGYSPTFDLATYFLHDVPPEVAAAGESHQRPEAQIVFAEPCRFGAWPKVPIHVLAGRGDRFFPLEFQRRVAHERLGLSIEEISGGHLVALSNPRGLVDQLLAYTR
jgi:pimeloyl-ACP methyl ester carboxylesterase